MAAINEPVIPSGFHCLYTASPPTHTLHPRLEMSGDTQLLHDEEDGALVARVDAEAEAGQLNSGSWCAAPSHRAIIRQVVDHGACRKERERQGGGAPRGAVGAGGPPRGASAGRGVRVRCSAARGDGGCARVDQVS